tara:strand:- start:5756 stop:5980 length:225 start_codon:yes stop_codon:yes gene_type:complete
MTPDALPIGSIVRCDYYGRGIIIDASPGHPSGTMLYHVRWDKSIEWKESPNYKAEIYQSCWVDDIDVEIISEAK